MNTTHYLMRRAVHDDALAIAALLGELGYPSTAAAVARRLDALRGTYDAVLVVDADGMLAGVISIHLIPLLHDDGRLGKLTALVVAADRHGQGIGTRLVRAAEDFAAARGARRIEVVSGDHRSGAHAFYRRLGYATTTQHRFQRALD